MLITMQEIEVGFEACIYRFHYDYICPHSIEFANVGELFIGYK